VIATIRVLGLTPAGAGAVVAAARRLVDYLQGTTPQPEAEPEPAPGLSGYYDRSGTAGRSPGAEGRSRGSAAGRVGLSGLVAGRELERLLTGRHVRTGRPLLPASGSAGRADRPRRGLGRLPEVVTLEEAAGAIGVSPGYLRRLARQQADNPPDRSLPRSLDDSSEGAVDADRRPAGRPVGDRLRARKEPTSGRWLVRREEVARFAAAREPPTVVIGYDLTCSAPKSVSLLWAFADDRLRADIAAALDAGVDAALGYLERHAAVGTVGGWNRPGLGLAAVSYRHEVSRADEAHLHVHNVIVNAVLVPVVDEDGQPVLDRNGVGRSQWRALDGEVLLGQVKAAGYVGAAVLRHELSVRRGLRWGPVRNGVAELAGFPRDVLEAFSSRRGQVLEEFAQLVHAGFTPDAATLAAAQRASRAPKRVLADEQVRAIQTERLRATGWTPDQVRGLAAPGEHRIQPPTEAAIRGWYDRLAGPVGLTERTPTFSPREVVQAVAAWAGDRLDAEAISTIAERFLADPRVVLLSTAGRRRRSLPDPTYTTVDLLAAEQRLLGLYRAGRQRDGLGYALVDPHLVETALAEVATGSDPGPSGEQADLVRRLLACGDLVRPVVGPAGTGKTEAMRAVVQALDAAGHRVLGAANGGRQAEDLHRRLRVPTQVVAGWLTLLDNVPDPGQVWPPGSVLIVDEATQVATRDAERLLAAAAASGTVAILIGDPAQLGSVGAGGWFAHLTAATPDLPALTTNQRQPGPALAEVRQALTDLRSLDSYRVPVALDRLAADGRLTVCADRSELMATVVTDWYTDRQHTPPGTRLADTPRMLAEHHRDVALLNRSARTLLRADGTLTGPILSAAGRQFQAGDEVITLTQAGHTLIPAGQPRSAYVRTGSIGTVTAVHPEQTALTVHFPGKGDVHVDHAYLSFGFPDGRDGGLDHAYALTAHKAEGATLPVARTLAADDTSRAGLYVMLSRARHDLRAYLIRRADLDHHPDDDESWLPILDQPTGPLARLAHRLEHSQPERLAAAHAPAAVAAHPHRNTHTLAELTRQCRAVHTGPSGDAPDPIVLRRAELAAETAIAATAPASPPADLLTRIGPRPGHGPDRRVWDAAVTALAVYHARWQPDAPAHQPGLQPEPGPDDEVADRWQQRRRHARQIAVGWAAGLDPAHHRGFQTRQQAVPRQRAIAGIHALLDHGLPPETLTAELTSREHRTARTAAALLDHRVGELLTRYRVDPTIYQTQPPASRRQDWQRVNRLLHAAETNHLAARPTRRLHAERQHLTTRLTHHPTTADDGGTDLSAIRARLELLDAALNRQIDHAAARFAHQPAGYLTALLGNRPTDPGQAPTWDRHALAVEHYRHHVLGLGYGTTADTPAAPPSRQALGPPASDPVQRHQQVRVAALQTTLDLSTGL
jgi:conjugative relaxase-like TrwC/TraI family protein